MAAAAIESAGETVSSDVVTENKDLSQPSRNVLQVKKSSKRKEYPSDHLAKPTPEKETFFVERILKKKIKDGKTMYLVKWKYYDSSHNTWEPRGSFRAELLRQYETSRQKREKAKKQRRPGRPSTKKLGSVDEEHESTDNLSNGSERSSEARTVKRDRNPKTGNGRSRSQGLSADDVAQLEMMTLDIPTLDTQQGVTTASDSSKRAGRKHKKAKQVLETPTDSEAEHLSDDQNALGNRNVRNVQTTRAAAKSKHDLQPYEFRDDPAPCTSGSSEKGRGSASSAACNSASKPSKMDLLLSSKKASTLSNSEPTHRKAENVAKTATKLTFSPNDRQDTDWPNWKPESTVSEFTLISDGMVEIMFEEIRLRPNCQGKKNL